MLFKKGFILNLNLSVENLVRRQLKRGLVIHSTVFIRRFLLPKTKALSLALGTPLSEPVLLKLFVLSHPEEIALLFKLILLLAILVALYTSLDCLEASNSSALLIFCLKLR